MNYLHDSLQYSTAAIIRPFRQFLHAPEAVEQYCGLREAVGSAAAFDPTQPAVDTTPATGNCKHDSDLQLIWLLEKAFSRALRHPLAGEKRWTVWAVVRLTRRDAEVRPKMVGNIPYRNDLGKLDVLDGSTARRHVHAVDQAVEHHLDRLGLLAPPTIRRTAEERGLL